MTLISLTQLAEELCL